MPANTGYYWRLGETADDYASGSLAASLSPFPTAEASQEYFRGNSEFARGWSDYFKTKAMCAGLGDRRE